MHMFYLSERMSGGSAVLKIPRTLVEAISSYGKTPHRISKLSSFVNSFKDSLRQGLLIRLQLGECVRALLDWARRAQHREGSALTPERARPERRGLGPWSSLQLPLLTLLGH